MAKSLFLVASLLVFLVAVAEPRRASTKRPEANEFRPIENITDPYYQSLGKWGVDEHNKEAKTDLKFQEVYSGTYDYKVAASYILHLRAMDGIVSGNYAAHVYITLQKTLLLLQFYAISDDLQQPNASAF